MIQNISNLSHTKTYKDPIKKKGKSISRNLILLFRFDLMSAHSVQANQAKTERKINEKRIIPTNSNCKILNPILKR